MIFVTGYFGAPIRETAEALAGRENCELVDLGLPVSSGFALSVKDVYTGEDLGKRSDYFNRKIPGHDMRLYLCRLVKK